MKDFLCYSIDAESRDGAPIARRFEVTGYPALLFLESDGTLREKLSGYLPPEGFVAEVQRIERNENTLSALRAAVESKPDDLALRYRFAMKLRGISDRDGFAEQMAAIRRRDPQGATPTGRQVRFDELWDDIYRSLRKGIRHELDEMTAFLGEETNPTLLHAGWALIGMVHEVDARSAKDAGLPDEAVDWSARSREAYRKAWPHTPEGLTATFGNQVAWAFWLSRDHISDADKEFALAVAKASAEAAGNEPAALDTLACCYFMNGERQKAIELVEQCLESDPAKAQWKKHLAEFRAAE